MLHVTLQHLRVFAGVLVGCGVVRRCRRTLLSKRSRFHLEQHLVTDSAPEGCSAHKPEIRTREPAWSRLAGAVRAVSALPTRHPVSLPNLPSSTASAVRRHFVAGAPRQTAAKHTRRARSCCIRLMRPVMQPCTAALQQAILTISFHRTPTAMVWAPRRARLALQVASELQTHRGRCERAAPRPLSITALTRHAEAGIRSWNLLDLCTEWAL